MSRQLQTQQVITQRLNALEQEIREIRKAIVVTQETKSFPEFPVIKQEQRQQAIEQAERQQAIEQAEQQQEFNCTLCSVTKPIDQRERKGKQKSSAYKQCANNRLKERRKKSKNNGTSRYECVCGSTFQRWGLTKHEQTNKHKMYIESTTAAADESGLELSDGVGADELLIVL